MTVVGRDHGPPDQAIGSAKRAGPAAEHEDVDPNTSAPAYPPDMFATDATGSVDADAAEAAEVVPAEVLENFRSDAFVRPEADSERLLRLVQFVARQEPGLRWAVSNREDGTTVLVTNLAHGWIRARSRCPRLCDCWNPNDASAMPPRYSGP